jgi:hypothetical protein
MGFMVKMKEKWRSCGDESRNPQETKRNGVQNKMKTEKSLIILSETDKFNILLPKLNLTKPSSLSLKRNKGRTPISPI